MTDAEKAALTDVAKGQILNLMDSAAPGQLAAELEGFAFFAETAAQLARARIAMLQREPGNVGH